MRTAFFPLVAISMAVPNATHAATNDIVPIVVSATRSPDRLDTVTRDVTIYSETEIMRASAQSLAEFLANTAGVQGISYGGAGTTSGLFLRGSNSNHVLVLIDGQRVGSSTSGLVTLENIGLSAIERIEVVRGPHSAFYGADAIGGVVHILTKRNAPTSVFVQAGTDQAATLAAQTSFASGAWSGNIAFSHDRSDGFNIITNPNNFSFNGDRDGFRRTGAVATLRFESAPRERFMLRAIHHDLNAQYDGSSDYNDRARTKTSALRFTAELDQTQLSFGVSQDDARFDSTFPGAFRTRSTEASAQHTWKLASGVQASAIVDARTEQIVTSEHFETSSRRTIGLVGRLSGELQAAHWSLAARIDDSDQFGTRGTGSAGVRIGLSKSVALFANIGNAFKAPSFNDLYYPGFSNPTLRPERTVGGDLGIRANWGQTQLGLTAHAARVKDLIVFQCDANFNCAPQNVRQARLEGLTLTAEQALSPNTHISASLDQQNPHDTESGHLLARRAKWFGTVKLSHQMRNMTSFISVSGSARRFDDAANQVPLAGYVKIDLGLNYLVSPQIAVEARIKNIADRTIVLATDFASPGRELFLGIRWTAQ